MSSPYIGEIRLFAGNFAPQGWALCDGQLLAIADNDALFNLIGTTYGGDGQSTFALPDLRGRAPIHVGSSHLLAQSGGTEFETLTAQQMPAHSHSVLASSAAAVATEPGGRVLAGSSSATVSSYGTDIPRATLHAQSISSMGGSQPHSNLQPYLTLNFILSLFGIFPSPT